MEKFLQKPEDLLKIEYHPIYTKDIESIWWEIVKLNSTLFVLNKIVKFNFKFFGSYLTKDHFWQILRQSLYESCLLSLWKIDVDNTFDKGKTLNQIKNEIIGNLKLDEDRLLFISEIKKNNYSKNVSELSEKVRLLRHNAVAHLNFEGIPRPSENEETKIRFEEIEYFTSQINILFEFICFGNGHFVVPLEYYEGDRVDSNQKHITDIEEILDTLVKESNVFKMPIERPQVWEHYHKKLSVTEVNLINSYREKFKMELINA
ncbi:MAG TPA: hypothetical protein PLZ15_08260 [Melioribacteraceae bacterium]|mgnify:CR=1 FL=1|nr:hypothetical protein [Melioribacteraceae bacterium]